MKAMILAAGLGTRLRPLTDNIPKALVELNGRTLLEITIDRLKSFGVTEFIVNAHHHAEKIADFLISKKNFGLRIEISREDDLLLDTGGGLKKAAWFFLEGNSNEPFIVHNVDVLSSIDLKQMLQFHKQNSALATLTVQQRPSSRQLLFDENNLLVGRRVADRDAPVAKSDLLRTDIDVGHSERSEESAFSFHPPLATRLPRESSPRGHFLLPLAFSGIHVISPRLLSLITESGVFSIIDTYLRLAKSGEKISAFRADSFYWRDLGRLEDLSAASLDLQRKMLF